MKLLAGLFVGIVLGASWAAYQGYQTPGAGLRRVRRLHPAWFRNDVEYPPYGDEAGNE